MRFSGSSLPKGRERSPGRGAVPPHLLSNALGEFWAKNLAAVTLTEGAASFVGDYLTYLRFGEVPYSVGR